MAASAEPQVDAVVNQTFARHPFAEARRVQQIDAARSQHPGPDAALAVRARTRLHDHRLDAGAIEQMREHEAGRPGSDDSNLSVHLRCYATPPPGSLRSKQHD